MPTFAYSAVTTRGARTSGQVLAESRADAIGSVEALGLVPVDVDALAADGPRKGAVPRAGGVAQHHTLHFVRQLGNLLTAGVPLARALGILCREAASPAAGRQWSAVRGAVVDGTALADALARFPRSFPPIYVAMVRAGETGGFLDVVLRQIAGFIARERELKSKVGTALIYPAVLAAIALGVVIFLLAWFIPRFAAIYDEFGQTLPLLTRAVREASDLVRGYGLFVLAGAAIVLLAARHYLRSDEGRRVLDRGLLRLPGVGTAAARFALVRFCSMLGTLIASGVPLVAALRVARQALGNQTLSDALDVAITQVQQGVGLARSLAGCTRLFPGSVVETIAVAEEAGRLADELTRLAGELEQDLDRRLRVLVSLAEPALLFAMAAVAGTIVIGMLLPVFDLWDAIQ